MSLILVLVFTLILALVASYWLLPTPWAKLVIALRRRRGGMTSRYIEVDGRRWHYLEGGEGEDHLLLLHGFGADADHWVEISRSLGQRFHLIAPDTPGFGETEVGPEYDFDIPAQVDALLPLLDALGMERFHLAGNSMGGYLAADLAVRYPERVRSLWLIAPFGMHTAEESDTQAAIRTGEDSPFDISSVAQFRQRVLDRMFGRSKWLPYPLVHVLAHNALSRLELGRTAYHHIVQNSPSLESIAPDIGVPTLVQWGTADQVTDASGAEPLANLINHSHLVMQIGTGHLPMLELPGDTVDIYRDFLAHQSETSNSRQKPILQS